MLKKVCSKCNKPKNLNAFRKLSGKVGLRAECRACLARRARKWREENPTYSKTWKKENKDLDALYQWRGSLKRKYGITETQFYKLLEENNKRCAICKREFESRPNVDHCHKTGRIRGILCKACNRGLGMFGDNLERLKSAVNYMEVFVEQTRSDS
jgi:hypothetical protein